MAREQSDVCWKVPLPAVEKLVLMYLATHAAKATACARPSWAQLSLYTGQDIEALKAILLGFEQRRFLVRERREKQSTLYFLQMGELERAAVEVPKAEARAHG